MGVIAKPIRPGRKAKRRALEAARVSGCTCRQPDIELVQWISDHVQHVRAGHDDGCPALGVQSTLVFSPAVWQR